MAALTPVLSVLTEEPGSPLADFFGVVRNVLHMLLFLPEPASSAASGIDDLQYFEFIVFWAIGIVILGAAAWFIVRYRRRVPEGFEVRTRRITAPLWLELGVSGTLLGIFVLWWVIGFRQYTDVMTPPPDAIDVYVTGRQWVWKFAYADGPTSAGVLYVPLDTPVRLILTSRDVIHSFFVPAFRLKQDAVPGRYTTTWFTATKAGRFQLMCAELCGTGHSRMLGEVVVLDADDFQNWLAGGDVNEAGPVGEPFTLSPEGEVVSGGESLAERGLRIAAEHGCLNCHTTDGARHLAPTWRGLYGSRVPLASGDTILATPAYLTESMMDPQAKIVAGYDPIMPTFQGQLEPASVAALVEYIRSIRRPVGAGATPGTGAANQPGNAGTAPDTAAGGLSRPAPSQDDLP